MGRSIGVIVAFLAGLIASPLIFPDGIDKGIANMGDGIRNMLPYHN